jgi:hypothetical protein
MPTIAIFSALAAAAASFAWRAVRTFLTSVRTVLDTARLRMVRLTRWRLRFSADGWLASTKARERGLGTAHFTGDPVKVKATGQGYRRELPGGTSHPGPRARQSPRDRREGEREDQGHGGREP